MEYIRKFFNNIKNGSISPYNDYDKYGYMEITYRRHLNEDNYGQSSHAVLRHVWNKYEKIPLNKIAIDVKDIGVVSDLPNEIKQLIPKIDSIFFDWSATSEEIFIPETYRIIRNGETYHCDMAKCHQ